MTFKEWGLAATMVLCITLWVLSGVLAMPPVYAALLGLSILLVTGILKWKVRSIIRRHTSMGSDVKQAILLYRVCPP